MFINLSEITTLHSSVKVNIFNFKCTCFVTWMKALVQ